MCTAMFFFSWFDLLTLTWWLECYNIVWPIYTLILYADWSIWECFTVYWNVFFLISPRAIIWKQYMPASSILYYGNWSICMYVCWFFFLFLIWPLDLAFDFIIYNFIWPLPELTKNACQHFKLLYDYFSILFHVW